MADFKCPYARQTGGGLIQCGKPVKAAAPPPKKGKGKKKGASEAPQTETYTTCGHQRYCPMKKKIILTEQAVTCPRRREEPNRENTVSDH